MIRGVHKKKNVNGKQNFEIILKLTYFLAFYYSRLTML